MNPVKALKITRSIFILSIMLLIVKPAAADPYILDCSSGNCQYVDANGSYLACVDSVPVLWAVNPDTSIDLSGASFQWWVFVRASEDNGWVDEWVTAIGGTGNRFEVTDNTSYQYYCDVSTVSNGSWSTSTVTVSYADNDVSIGSAPEDETVCPGVLVELYSTASGSHATKQWERRRPGGEWQEIPGESAEYYTFTAVPEDDGTFFRYRVSNVCGTSVSRAAEIGIHDPPEITGEITSASKCEGTTATYSVSASGSELSYTWQYSSDSGQSWTDIVNGGHYLASVNNLTVSDITPEMDRDLFRCEVSGICDFSTHSDSALLNVLLKPYLSRQPAEIVSCLGEQVELHARGEGTEPIMYEWRRNGVSVSNPSTDTNLIIPSVTVENAGNYLVRLTNQCSSVPVASDEAALVVNLPPSFTSQPADLGFCEGSIQTAEFSIQATGDQLEYAWQYSHDGGINWTNLSDTGSFSGASSAQLEIQAPGTGHSGFDFRCLISGVCGDPLSSDVVGLEVRTVPVVINSPVNQSACLQEEVSFSVSVSGTAPLSYQWKANNQSVTEWISDSSLNLTEISFADAKSYHVVIRNECNMTGISSDAAELTVNAIPVINLGEDVHLCDGDSSVLNAGSGFFKYEWSTGDSTQSITVTSQNTIEVLVWNQEGCSGGDAINIIMDPDLPELDLGGDRALCQGDEAILDAGDMYDSYSWSNQTVNRSLPVSASGTYWVTASRNNSVCIVSDTVSLHFNEPYSDDNICLVTTDFTTGNNIIVWERTQDVGTAAYNIYRQTNILNQYEIIGTVPFDQLSVFEDTVADPEQRQWVYKITALDTCGNESDISDAVYHIPLFLQYQSAVNGVNLKWEKYQVGNSTMDFVSYDIYRGADSTSLTRIGSLSSDLNVFRDTDPNALQTRFYYRIAGVRAEACHPADARKAGTGPYTHSLSNLDDNKLKESTFINTVAEPHPLDIFPNPMNDLTTVRFDNPDGSEYRMVIRDFSGKAVHMKESIRTGEVRLSRENLSQGYYFVQISGKKQFRGKLIVK